jgi:hypothetical protein
VFILAFAILAAMKSKKCAKSEDKKSLSEKMFKPRMDTDSTDGRENEGENYVII